MPDFVPAQLPDRPSLEQLRNQARELLRAWRAGDAPARERVRAHKPQATEPALADAQFALAREYGFDSWPRLVRHVEARRAHDRAAPRGLSAAPPFYRIDWSTGTIEPRQRLTTGEWDTIIGVVRDLGLARIAANGQMTDEALDRLSRVEHVTALGLGGTQYLSDDGLASLARLHRLRELDLSDHPGGRITDRGLAVLRELPDLRRFQMCWQGGVTDAGIAGLAACDRIERVDLLGSNTGDGAIAALRGKTRLRHFKTGRRVTDAGVRMLRDLPVFASWQGGEPAYDLMTFGDAEPNFLMLDGPFSDAGFADIAALEGLFGLGFFWHATGLTPAGLRALAGLPHLGALGCEGRLCDDVAMRHIAAIPRLRMLMAQGTVATDQGFVALARSRSLEYLWGRECPNLGGPGFSALAGLPSLKGLAVSLARVDDAALQALPHFPALSWLLPMDLTDDGFRHVGRCARLEKLTCMYCRDTGDAATAHIADLPRLAHYYAGQTRITDRSLEILGGMTSLEVVELSGCGGISDAGLAHLAALPRLRRVSVDASAAVTRAGIAVFPPAVRVDFWP